VPTTTYVELEMAFRSQDLGVYLIAVEKEDMAPTYTNMDLQGNLEKKYQVTMRTSMNPKRPKEQEIWPATPEDNLERLKNAGEPVDRGIPLCSRCSVLGHTVRSCPEEKQEDTERPGVKCHNCDSTSHRIRDW
jgi:hypothetical protein